MVNDKCPVKIVGITKPLVEGIDTAEEFIAYCARVSNPKNQMNKETAPKLLKYCADNGHWSIFEMVSLNFEINTTRDIGRQILRHRSFSFQEFSQRYSQVQNFTERECRLQDEKNRQNSISIDSSDSNQLELDEWFNSTQNEITEFAKEKYNEAIERGIAKEQARSILPEGLTMSTMYMHGTLRSWIHYVNLRAENGTQKEHALIAYEIKNIILEYFPSLKEILQ